MWLQVAIGGYKWQMHGYEQQPGATSSNVVATRGKWEATNGNLEATSGNWMATCSNVVATKSNWVVTSGNLVATYHTHSVSERQLKHKHTQTNMKKNNIKIALSPLTLWYTIPLVLADKEVWTAECAFFMTKTNLTQR